MTTEHWTADRIGDLAGRVAIVTGANTGIGKETARALAQKGARVVLACRSAARGEDALRDLREAPLAGTVELELLDLSSLASVRDFAGRFKGRTDRLDLLINNAGVMMPPASKTAEGFELQFGTNHLGHFALTGLLADLLLGTEGSRVVTVSSEAHKWGEINFDDLQWEARPYKKMAAYGQSKLANLIFAYELQRRLGAAGSGTRSLAAHPGWTGTDLQRNSSLFRFFNPILAMRPWQGALPTLRAATDPAAAGGVFFGPHGFMGMRGYPVPVTSTPASRDEDIARRLWEISEALTGVSFQIPTRAG